MYCPYWTVHTCSTYFSYSPYIQYSTRNTGKTLSYLVCPAISELDLSTKGEAEISRIRRLNLDRLVQ